MIGLGDYLRRAERIANTWPARDGDIPMQAMSDRHLFYTLAMLYDEARMVSPRYLQKLSALRREAARRLR